MIRISLAPFLLLSVVACSQSPIDQAETAVTSALSSGAEPQFRGIRHNDVAACGEFDIKGAAGKYLGFRRFIYLRPENRVIVDPGAYVGDDVRTALGSIASSVIGREEFDAIWTQVCIT